MPNVFKLHLCDDCDVRNRCVMRLFAKEMDSCLLFSKRPDEIAIGEGVSEIELDELLEESGYSRA